MAANFATWPGAKNITGRFAFSAAGQNQSAVPSDSHDTDGPLNSTRTPSMPGWSRHLGKRAADCGSLSGMRPMTWKRSG